VRLPFGAGEATMPNTVNRAALSAPLPLVLDLLEWLAPGPRPYADTLEAWRTSCPRLTVWEDARDAGLVARCDGPGVAMAALTEAGREALAAAGR
jgi:hypothetical protein